MQTKYEEKKIVMPQTIIKAYGSGPIGKNNNTYELQILEATKSFLLDVFSHTNKTSFELGEFFFIDDDKATWLNSLAPRLRKFFDGPIGKAKKHDTNNDMSWGLNSRVINFQNEIDYNYVMVDKRNSKLLKDISASILKADGTKRDETGYKHRIYNSINSKEYADYPWKNRVYYQIQQSHLE